MPKDTNACSTQATIRSVTTVAQHMRQYQESQQESQIRTGKTGGIINLEVDDTIYSCQITTNNAWRFWGSKPIESDFGQASHISSSRSSWT